MNSYIIFDDNCNLCSAIVRFIKKNKKFLRYNFLPNSNEEVILSQFNLNTKKIDYIILIKNNKSFIKSEAIFEILSDSKSLLKMFLVFKILPLQWNNYLYDLVAKYRYIIFGKKDNCNL